MASNARLGLKANAWISTDNVTYTIITETRALSVRVNNAKVRVTPHTTSGGVVISDYIRGEQDWEFTVDGNLVQTETALDLLESAALNQTDVYLRFAREVGSGKKRITMLCGVETMEQTGPDTGEQRVTYKLFSRGTAPVSDTQ